MGLGLGQRHQTHLATQVPTPCASIRTFCHAFMSPFSDTATLSFSVWSIPLPPPPPPPPLPPRSTKEVEDEEYAKFYKVFTKDSQDPLATTHFVAEGEVTFRSILFVPPVSRIPHYCHMTATLMSHDCHMTSAPTGSPSGHVHQLLKAGHQDQAVREASVYN